MSILARAIIFSFICTILPLSISYAQENKADEAINEEEILSLEQAKELIFKDNSAKDAVGGTVKPSPKNKYYDIYMRQLAYRENAKEFTKSIKERQVAFEEPRIEAIKEHDAIVEKVYVAESADYQKNLEESSNEDKLENTQKNKISISEASSNSSTANTNNASPDTKTGVLKEEIIPPQNGDEEKIKKVITSEDAPDFDPANL